ncbi:universal stress protein [Thermobispora bispora]|uniref:UspA domain protein n=1 Tax=Thermobispora bispora (strain ATCC 19993 / DSM 43833 / CBS 139.67 / JCM 10125 / KCTC 9307 / NBRC 14880 / R51) TaxID=469371 RepID=D6YBM1_THEBD|nr:universal stress protein [Thermobispora bispora]ADG88581.1 UspA domain protein [Thermobispora bispora DSM 43833]
MTSQRYRRVIVGFDGSPAAVAALDWASAEARLHGASLVICTVVPDGQEPATSDALATLRRSVQELIGGEPEVRCVPGSPAVALITACTPSDLLVLGAHGRSARSPACSWGRSAARACTAPPARWRWSRPPESGRGTTG